MLFRCQTWWHQSASVSVVLTPANCQDNLLRKIADWKLSFAELKQHASEINDLQVPKTEFVKKAGCKSWKEADGNHPIGYRVRVPCIFVI